VKFQCLLTVSVVLFCTGAMTVQTHHFMTSVITSGVLTVPVLLAILTIHNSCNNDNKYYWKWR